MRYRLVEDIYDEGIQKIAIHSEQIECVSMKEDGKWPACLSPMTRELYKPFYSMSSYQDGDDLINQYRCQFFVEDLESDCFIVEVIEVATMCETYIHNHPDSVLNHDILESISDTVREVEHVLMQLVKQDEKELTQ